MVPLEWVLVQAVRLVLEHAAARSLRRLHVRQHRIECVLRVMHRAQHAVLLERRGAQRAPAGRSLEGQRPIRVEHVEPTPLVRAQVEMRVPRAQVRALREPMNRRRVPRPPIVCAVLVM